MSNEENILPFLIIEMHILLKFLSSKAWFSGVCLSIMTYENSLYTLSFP